MMKHALVPLLVSAAAFVSAVPSSATRPSDVPAQGDTPAQVIYSDSAGALDEPRLWDCDRIEPEYRRWLADGNRAETWRFVGKTYRVRDTGELYNWQDWLDWVDDAGCGAGYAAEGTPRGVIGGGVFLIGLAVLFAGFGGGGADSPG